MRKILLCAAVLALTAAWPAAATDAEDEWEPNLHQERVYFTCGATKAANLDAWEGNAIGWDTDEPAASYQAGGGCGHLDTAQLAANDSRAHATFSGTFTGNLDTLTVHAWAIEGVWSRFFESVYIDVTVLVDDWDYVWQHETIIPPTSNDDASLFEFSVHDIGLLAEDDDTEHDVTVIIHASPYLADGDQNLWVFDAAEVPSGITFNPDDLADVSIRAF